MSLTIDVRLAGNWTCLLDYYLIAGGDFLTLFTNDVTIANKLANSHNSIRSVFPRAS